MISRLINKFKTGLKIIYDLVMNFDSKFLPLTGGTLSGNKISLLNGKGAIYVSDQLTQIETHNDVDGNNNMRFLSITNSDSQPLEYSVRISSKDDGVNKVYAIYGEHNKSIIPFLPLSSGTLTGKLIVKPGVDWGQYQLYSSGGKYAAFESNDNIVRIDNRDTNSTSERRCLDFKKKSYDSNIKDALILVEYKGETNTSYRIFGEHNKPYGTYTGNATARTIDIGGISHTNTIIITGDRVYYVTAYGAIARKNSTISGISDSDVNFNGNKLTLSASSLLNQNGQTYKYQVV